MIAALATCVFVYWLYKSLNTDSVEVPDDAVSGAVSTADLTGRLHALQTRLQTLIDSADAGANKS